eukprot:TRINITY_DN17420_c0_g1_i1.p1 TRINITY_DN17420_c0_g1~~TRINITY_DN17420_c0_g1_i1.p1  ORF type:complete len:117 (-),score=20.19 TRINITY_DN17420_c0_g1_i1:37-348(-)
MKVPKDTHTVDNFIEELIMSKRLFKYHLKTINHDTLEYFLDASDEYTISLERYLKIFERLEAGEEFNHIFDSIEPIDDDIEGVTAAGGSPRRCIPSPKRRTKV